MSGSCNFLYFNSFSTASVINSSMRNLARSLLTFRIFCFQRRWLRLISRSYITDFKFDMVWFFFIRDFLLDLLFCCLLILYFSAWDNDVWLSFVGGGCLGPGRSFEIWFT